jgi:cysteine synthase
MAGISSGAALHAALTISSREDVAAKMIVVFWLDTPERYVTPGLFSSASATRLA